MAYRLNYAGKSEFGGYGEINRDEILLDGDENLFAVADGMPGRAVVLREGRSCNLIPDMVPPGEPAAELAIRTLETWYRESIAGPDSVEMPIEMRADLSWEQNRLWIGVQLANLALYRVRLEESPPIKMASIAALGCVDDQFHFFHAGNSRLYRLRDGRLERMTADHELENTGLEAGDLEIKNVEMDDDAQSTMPRPDCLIRALGLGSTLEVSLTTEEPRDGDAYLLCTAGLHRTATDGQLEAVLRERAGDPSSAVIGLLSEAPAEENHDDKSAVVVEVREA